MHEDLYKTKELITQHGTPTAKGKKITHLFYILKFLFKGIPWFSCCKGHA